MLPKPLFFLACGGLGGRLKWVFGFYLDPLGGRLKWVVDLRMIPENWSQVPGARGGKNVHTCVLESQLPSGALPRTEKALRMFTRYITTKMRVRNKSGTTGHSFGEWIAPEPKFAHVFPQNVHIHKIL